VDWGGWAEEEVPPPPDVDVPALWDDPTLDVLPWELTDAEKRIYEAGFIAGYELQTTVHANELADLNHEADRLYRAAFDHRDCRCWKQHRR
jgi:hypothetical protein